jgi:hypothetical protein
MGVFPSDLARLYGVPELPRCRGASRGYPFLGRRLKMLAAWVGEKTLDKLPPEAAGEGMRLPAAGSSALAMIGAMIRLRPTAWKDALRRLKSADLEAIEAIGVKSGIWLVLNRLAVAGRLVTDLYEPSRVFVWTTSFSETHAYSIFCVVLVGQFLKQLD